jgi:hypothetical protein
LRFAKGFAFHGQVVSRNAKLDGGRPLIVGNWRASAADYP